MTLKNWNLASCPLKDLGGGSPAAWTASGSGTGEYYYTGGDLSIKPNAVYENGSSITEGTLGSLSASEWGWGDNDSLGYDTLYIRLTDDADPDSKAADYAQCSDLYEIFQGGDGNAIILLSILISNYSVSEGAEICIIHTDSSDNILFKWIIDLLSGSSPLALDSKICFNNMDKYKIMSSIEDVCILISGDES